MKILLVSATEIEIQPSLVHLKQNGSTLGFSHFVYNQLNIHVLVTGIGSTMMAFGLARLKGISEFDLVIHIGISGSFNESIPILEMVEVVSECWGDLGSETAESNFLDCFETNLMDANRYPYTQTKLFKIKKTPPTQLTPVNGITVNCTSGSAKRIELLKNKYHCDVESMEGAGLFYAALTMDIPFISIRCISNIVEPRDKSKWMIPEAIELLNQNLISYLDKIKS